MFFRKKRHSIMGMMKGDSGKMMSAMKMVAAGAVLYHTARYMINEMMD